MNECLLSSMSWSPSGLITDALRIARYFLIYIGVRDECGPCPCSLILVSFDQVVSYRALHFLLKTNLKLNAIPTILA